MRPNRLLILFVLCFAVVSCKKKPLQWQPRKISEKASEKPSRDGQQNPNGASTAAKTSKKTKDPDSNGGKKPSDQNGGGHGVCANAGGDKLSKDQLSPKQRASVICRFKESLWQQYSLWKIKEQRLGIKINDHLEACAKKELSIKSDALDRLRFSGRFLKCLSMLQDTHMVVEFLNRQPQIYAGIGFVRVANKVVIANVNRQILERSLDKDFVKKLRPGIELIEVNGRPVAEVVKSLSRYVLGSSLDYRLNKATELISKRNFLYPNENRIDFKFAGEEDSVSLKWWLSSLNFRKDARDWAEKAKVQSLAKIDPKLLNKVRRNEDGYGYRKTLPIYAKPIVEYRSEAGEIGLRLSLPADSKVPLCYMQLLTFATNRWSSNGKTYPFLEPIEKFVEQCKSQQLPLVFDLRNNAGGNPDHVDRLMGVLAESGKEYPSTFFSGRITKFLIDVLNNYDGGQGLPKAPIKIMPHQKRLKALEQALKDQSEYLPAVPLLNIKPSDKIGGYDQTVLVLTSSACVSSCELMVNHLMSSQRAFVLGAETNGTGGRFLEFNKRSNEWRDDLYNTFAVRIANSLYGVSKQLAADEVFSLSIADHMDRIRENSPLQPHEGMLYIRTQEDIALLNQGWRKRIQSFWESISGDSQL